MSKIFHFCTILNDRRLYNQMRDSLEAAGFSDDNCTYTILDNSGSNLYEPYSAFNSVADQRLEPYVIFCHQDVLFNQGDGYSELVQKLEELCIKDPDWALAGNAGIRSDFQHIAWIVDPGSTVNWTGSFPEKVITLDENFLIFRNNSSNSNVRWTTTLSGFHFYGSDVCLNAIVRGRCCYVIDFKLKHLSRGHLNESFWIVKKSFHRHWNSRFHLAFIVSPTGIFMVLSKHFIICYLLNLRFIVSKLNRRKLGNFDKITRVVSSPSLGMAILSYTNLDFRVSIKYLRAIVKI